MTKTTRPIQRTNLIDRITDATQGADFPPIADVAYNEVMSVNPSRNHTSQSMSSAWHNTQNTRKSLFLRFGLEIIDEADVDSHDRMTMTGLDIGPQIPTLECNKRYIVRVTADTGGMAGSEILELTDTDNVQLKLGIWAGGVEGINIPVLTCPLPYERANGFSFDFNLDLLPSCTRRKVTLGVIAIYQSGKKTRSLAELPVDLDGIPGPPVDVLVPARMNPDFRYPPNVGSLFLQEQSATSFLATCITTQSGSDPMLSVQFPKPMLNKVAEFPKDEQELPEYVRLFLKYARQDELAALRTWLEQLREIHGDHLVIIITDLTVSNLPWELLELSGLGQDQFLGALARVVRRLPSQTLPYEDTYCRGDGLAYVAPGLTRADQKRNTLTNVGVKLFESFDDLRRHLLGLGIEGAALVYLDCHGAFSYTITKLSDVRKVRLETGIPNESITVLELEDIPMCNGERPLFVANACHSAKILKDRGGFFGLPEVLLARCASGYIGAIGPITTDSAKDLCDRLASDMSAPPQGLHAAEFLRQWRSDAAQVYSDHRADTKEIRKRFYLAFCCAFMYVYYGDPLARWSLRKQSYVDPQSGVAV